MRSERGRRIESVLASATEPQAAVGIAVADESLRRVGPKDDASCSRRAEVRRLIRRSVGTRQVQGDPLPQLISRLVGDLGDLIQQMLNHDQEGADRLLSLRLSYAQLVDEEATHVSAKVPLFAGGAGMQSCGDNGHHDVDGRVGVIAGSLWPARNVGGRLLKERQLGFAGGPVSDRRCEVKAAVSNCV